MGDKQTAANTYKEAVRLSPKDCSLWLKLANTYPAQETTEIEEALQNAEALKPSDAVSWYGIGLAYQSLRKSKEAELALREAAQIEPTNSVYLFALGQLCVARGERSKAKDIYERLKAVDPNAADLLFKQIKR